MAKILDFSTLKDTQDAMARIAGRRQTLRYFLFTYGCQMNEHDSQKLRGMLESMGVSPADTVEQADIIILNTCCVREHAEVKVFGNLGRLRLLKQKSPHLIIGVCGCMMQQEGMAQETLRRFPHVDIVFGTHHLQHFPVMLADALEQRAAGNCTQSPQEELVLENAPVRRDGGHSAWVTIMYGCDNFCSYCIVPYVRGRERSRRPETILEEIRVLQAQGVREVTLLGQNVNSYGAGEDTRFHHLLEMIARETDIARIRFMTSHPKDLSDALIETMARTPQVCAQLHLPVQSGSDRILAAMNRQYTAGHYIGLVEKLRAAMPDIGISTDAIVGFPGENEEDFQDTLRLFEQARFLSAYTFKYSRRSGTPAFAMPGQVPDAVKKERLARLNALQQESCAKEHRRMVGLVCRVMVDQPHKRSKRMVLGRAEQGHNVAFEGGADLIGQIHTVRITQARIHSLVGQRIDER